MKKPSRKWPWVALALLCVAVGALWWYIDVNEHGSIKANTTYAEFLLAIKANKLKHVIIDDVGHRIKAEQNDGQRIIADYPDDDFTVTNITKAVATSKGLTFELRAKPVPFWSNRLLQEVLVQCIPFLIIVVFLIFYLRKSTGGALGFGKSNVAMIDPAKNTIRFSDVAGCDEAKAEVSELVEFLHEPKKWKRLGGHMPHGVLLIGTPGNGKTLLAKAIAGEARVPFFIAPRFTEMFVGVGAARVEDMFKQAKKIAPCIVFIDEIDGSGRARGAGNDGGTREQDMTLNQLLIEMDGFEDNSGVVVIAATNRPDVLDPALLRPGRFDRQVVVPSPDIRGREAILNVHVRKVSVAPDVDTSIIARGTPGFSGADLANVVNEAALHATREKKKMVELADFEWAREKVMMGAERKSLIMSEAERRMTAYHESGHTVVAKLLSRVHPVHKVTIMPRGLALGLTMFLPDKDRYSEMKEEVLQNISVLFGGRIAEEIFTADVSKGASDDLRRATKLAEDMVKLYAMGDPTILSPRIYGSQNGHVNSEATMQKIEREIDRIVREQYALARKLVEENRTKVEAMTAALLEWETLDADQINDIMEGKPPRAPKKS